MSVLAWFGWQPPWENGPIVEPTPAFNRLLAAFRLDSPAWDSAEYPPATRPDRVRALFRTELEQAVDLNYRELLESLVETYRETNITPVSFTAIEQTLFGAGSTPKYRGSNWFSLNSSEVQGCQQLSQLEFVLLYGALELGLPIAAKKVRRRPPN